MVERLNRSIGETLAKLVSSHQRDWDEYLGAVRFTHNTAHHTSISDIPYRVVFKELPRTLLDVSAAAVVPPSRYLRHLMPMSYLICMNRSTFTTVVLARHVDISTINTLNFHPYQVGDHVWAVLHSRGRGKSRSLSDRWGGPFIVVEKLSDVIYVLRKPRGRKLYTLHYDCLKPFVAHDPALIQNHPP